MKPLRRILLALLLLVAVLATSATLLVRASLPALDGELTFAGLDAPVNVARDASGIPTITAESREDLAFATGFVHAQDRFFQMDLARRKAAGELAALVGPAALRLDRQSRLHRLRSRARVVIERMAAAERSILDAYVAGVNSGLQSLGARPFEYFVLRSAPTPWHGEDSLLVGYAMFIELNDENATRDVQRGLAKLALPEQVFTWLYPDGTQWDAPLRGSSVAPGDLPDAENFDLREWHEQGQAATLVDEEGLMPGSNNWAVAGRLTASGRALVANDVHLGIAVPGVFYRARLIQTGSGARDTNGVTLPGVPVMVTGSNGNIAWALTNSYGDWTDAVLLREGESANSYLTPDGERHYVEHLELIEVKGGDDVELLVRETIWGPVLPASSHPEGEIAVSWIAHAPDGINIAQLGLETAADVQEAIRIANRVAIPPQNFVVGDAQGNIAWTIAGRIPVRGAADSRVPSDWSTGEGWSGWVAPAHYPKIVNPESGRIWTANTRVVDGQGHAMLGDGGYALGARATQIRDDLMQREEFSPVDMLAIQLDDRALFLRRWQALLLQVLDEKALADSPRRAEYRRLVADWVPAAVAESVGYRLVRAFRRNVRERAFRMLTLPVRAKFGDAAELRISNQFEAPLWQLVSEQPAHLLSADYAGWQDFLLRSVDEVLERHTQDFAGPLASRTWGEANVADIRHPLSRALPILSGWLDMPVEPLDGDQHMPRVQRPSFGAAERFAVAPGDEASGYLHLPGGASGHPGSPYYRAGHADWTRGLPSSFLPGVAEHQLELLPQS